MVSDRSHHYEITHCLHTFHIRALISAVERRYLLLQVRAGLLLRSMLIIKVTCTCNSWMKKDVSLPQLQISHSSHQRIMSITTPSTHHHLHSTSL